MKTLLTLLFLGTVTTFVATPTHAVPATELRMRILPKDCVFDIIDSGTQELLYYTPDACGFPPTEPTPTPVDTSPITTTTTATTPRPQLRPDVVDSPVLDNFNDGATITEDSVVLEGTAVPGAQINVYENGKKVGSVFADVAGKWTIKYTPTTSPVTLTFEACVNGACSVLSKTTTLYFSALETAANKSECLALLTLLQYRFWDQSTSDKVVLTLESKIPYDGVIEIDWGNGAKEVFDYDKNSPSEFMYRYQKTGNYNGTITYRIAGNSTNACEAERFFSVAVTRHTTSLQFLWLLLVALLMYGGYRIWYRSKESGSGPS